MSLVEAEIKNILESVPGIGLVYDSYVNVTNEEEVRERLVKDDKVNTMFFMEVQDIPVNVESFWDKEDTKLFRFALYYDYSFQNNSSVTVKAIKESLMSKFNLNETLNGTVTEHENIRMIDYSFVNFGSILCHFLVFELTVVLNLEISNF